MAATGVAFDLTRVSSLGESSSRVVWPVSEVYERFQRFLRVLCTTHPHEDVVVLAPRGIGKTTACLKLEGEMCGRTFLEDERFYESCKVEQAACTTRVYQVPNWSELLDLLHARHGEAPIAFVFTPDPDRTPKEKILESVCSKGAVCWTLEASLD